MSLQVTGAAQGPFLSTSQKSGIPSAFSTGFHNELLVSELMPRYAYLVASGNVYSGSVANANPTGVSTGILGAAGTPLILVWNPAGTNRNFYILQAFVSIRANGTVGPGSFVWSAGATAAVTANLSQPVNLASL